MSIVHYNKSVEWVIVQVNWGCMDDNTVIILCVRRDENAFLLMTNEDCLMLSITIDSGTKLLYRCYKILVSHDYNWISHSLKVE